MGKFSFEYPPVIMDLVGRELLLKVEEAADHAVRFDDSFGVKKICDDFSIIGAFKDKAKIQTPEKILRLEFAHYDYKARKTISAKDFALSMVASADMSHIGK